MDKKNPHHEELNSQREIKDSHLVAAHYGEAGERIENLKAMYKKYAHRGMPVAANRVLDRLRELGLTEQDILNLRAES